VSEVNSQGLNTAYAGAECSQAYPKLAKVNQDRGKTFMTERAKVVEVFRPCRTVITRSTTTDAFSYAYHNAYVLKLCHFNQPMDIW
jgi:hypothetical protein